MPDVSVEACKWCQSDDRKVFTSEVAIHVPGLAGLKKPIVWTFPALVVCLNCGCTEFTCRKENCAFWWKALSWTAQSCPTQKRMVLLRWQKRNL